MFSKAQASCEGLPVIDTSFADDPAIAIKGGRLIFPSRFICRAEQRSRHTDGSFGPDVQSVWSEIAKPTGQIPQQASVDRGTTAIYNG